jgi:hypothetical protein
MKLVREGEWGQGDLESEGEPSRREPETLPSAQFPPGDSSRTLITRPADGPELEA